MPGRWVCAIRRAGQAGMCARPPHTVAHLPPTRLRDLLRPRLPGERRRQPRLRRQLALHGPLAALVDLVKCGLRDLRPRLRATCERHGRTS
eukprot:353827-Chlamydomonas_euryale.AAC.1